MRDRPFGVTLLGILSWVDAVLAALLGLALLGVGLAVLLHPDRQREVAAGGVLGGVLIAIGAFVLILAVIQAVVGWGLLSLQSWAWTVAVVVNLFSAAGDVINLLARGSNIFGTLLSLAISLVILFYLFSADVQRAFGRR
jgi:uncharacterized membrane protein (DUF2068 family)